MATVKEKRVNLSADFCLYEKTVRGFCDIITEKTSVLDIL